MRILGNQDHAIPTMIYADAQALGAALAMDILAGAAQALRQGRRYLLGCPGGRSAMTTYQALGHFAAERQQDVSHLIIVMMDEYVFQTAEGYHYCPAHAHYSCRRFAEEAIVEVINRGLDSTRRITTEHVWCPNPADPAEYDARLRTAGGIDLFIVATGASDGHVAFNPPGTAEDSMSRIIHLADSTRRDNLVTFPQFTGLQEVPTYGVSVGLGTIAALSREVVLIAHGDDKQDAVRRLAAHADFTPVWPASIIFRSPGARVLLDKAAAHGLDAHLMPPSP